MECKLRDFQKLIALEARYHANCQTCWIVKHIHTMCMMNHLKNWLMPFRVGKRDCLQMNKILLIYPSRKKDEEAIKYTSHKVKPLRVIESHCSEFIVFYQNNRGKNPHDIKIEWDISLDMIDAKINPVSTLFHSAQIIWSLLASSKEYEYHEYLIINQSDISLENGGTL